MSELLKKQNYGVEVEFTGISRKMAADAVAEIIGTAASRPDRTCYQTRTIQDSQGRKWKVMRDSSIHPIRKVGTENMDEYRVEFVTPVLKYEDLDTLQAIIRKFREIGGVPHSSCGIHIHVDGANHTATSLRRLVNFMYSRQEIIYDALAVGDRKYRWCQPVCKNLLDTMKKDKNITTDSVEKIWYSPANDGYCGGINHQHYNSTRYHALNLHSFFQKGTVEFRLFNSTLHAGKIKAYVQFCLALSAWSIESDDKVVFRTMNGYTAKKKVTLMYNILTNRLGLYGDEFKTCRLHMMKQLRENAKKEWKQGYTIYDWNGKAVYPEQKKDTSSSKAKVSLTEKLNIQLPVLQSGTEGSAVRCLQAILGVAVDGDFGKNTKTALKTFQKNVGIDDDGCCGQNTWKKIADHMNANTFK